MDFFFHLELHIKRILRALTGFIYKRISTMRMKISSNLNSIVNFAREEAMRCGSYQIEPDHLMLGLLRHGTNYGAMHLKMDGVELEEMKMFLDDKLSRPRHIPYEEIDAVTLSRAGANILTLAVLEAMRFSSDTVVPEHLLLALTKTPGNLSGVYLAEHGITYRVLVRELKDLGLLPREEASPENIDGTEVRFTFRRPDSGEPSEGDSTVPGASEEGSEDMGPSEEGSDADPEEDSQRQSPRKKFADFFPPEYGEGQEKPKESLLDQFGYDLTAAAREHRLDPVVGREDEIMRVIQILGRRKKNNAMLIGDPGVGKSAIVEGIAIRITTGEIPPALKDRRLISLDIASVVAGTRYRGDFEKRLKGIMNEISENPDVILFIDEFHTIVGAGGGSGSLDAANILKPALARGEIQCIGATTLDEFRKVVEKDGALDRRFQKVMVEPTSEEQTLSILQRMCPRYEQYHGVSYDEDALRACVGMSQRYITDRCLPDKALDVMDEAGSMVRLRGGEEPRVEQKDVAEVISKITGIPVSNVARSERVRLLEMQSRLARRVIGQDDAVESVVRAIRRNRAGIKDPLRPVGSFLFIGPTGVGKTSLAKCLAEYLFDSQDNIIRIDMSEYGEKFNVSRLIGAPPGYVGYDEGGQLSEKVRRKPYSVVLLDEIEKAHPDVFNLLLQVLDDGRLTDSNGFTVDFRNTILIMTSNAGSREVDEYGAGVGFASAGRNVEVNRKAVVEKVVKKTFPPEFLNRIDEIVYFRSLSGEDIRKIVDIELKALQGRILEAGYTLKVTPGVKRLLAEVGFDPSYGARPLRRAVQRFIEDPVSEYIISAGSHRGKSGEKTLHISLSKDGNSTVVTD